MLQSLTMVGVATDCVQLSIYSEAKEQLSSRTELQGISLHFVASMISGLATTITSLPGEALSVVAEHTSHRYSFTQCCFLKVASRICY